MDSPGPNYNQVSQSYLISLIAKMVSSLFLVLVTFKIWNTRTWVRKRRMDLHNDSYIFGLRD